MKSDGITPNKRTVLVLRDQAEKLIATEKAAIEAAEAEELAELDRLLAKQ